MVHGTQGGDTRGLRGVDRTSWNSYSLMWVTALHPFDAAYNEKGYCVVLYVDSSAKQIPAAELSDGDLEEMCRSTGRSLWALRRAIGEAQEVCDMLNDMGIDLLGDLPFWRMIRSGDGEGGPPPCST